jgi:hypothetical protein
VLQVLAEHPQFALSGAEAVAAGMANDVEAYATEKAITFGGWRTVQQGHPGYTVQVKGAGHLSFLDVGLLPVQGEGPVKAMLAATSIEPRRMWRVTCDVLLAFFATHLQQAATPPLLAGPSDDYPELAYGPP